jgi:ABC-type Fe2+-enterobactin transport system substrate-binding protein
MYAGRQISAKNLPYPALADGRDGRNNAKERRMISKVLSAAVMAGLLAAVSAPVVAYAADAPKTKSACKKVTGMKWDKKTKSCVKK